MEIYCTQLGMVADFAYCISANQVLPCRNVIGCWQERLDIIAFLGERFTLAELKECFAGLPKSKLDRIMEAMHLVKREDV
jgi:hypothetical protein